uniref:Rhoptry protein n=1 Tax=Babesia ovis TaxID=5869 RepID=Q17256_BABOV|nr:rhoptry protein [Babesia ovis]
MRAISSVVGCAFWLVAGSTYAIRHQQQAANLAPAEVVGDLTHTLKIADEIINAENIEHEINRDMHLRLVEEGSKFIDQICQEVAEDSKCREQVESYVKRCEENNCLQIDEVAYPLNQEYQPLLLPEPYQLDAAFTLFKNCESNPAKNGLKGPWMRYKEGKEHGDYHHFIISLLGKSLVRKDGVTDLEFLVNKLLYMATTYYKTYLIVKKFGARFFNTFSFTMNIFGIGIKRALKGIVRSNVPEDMGEHSIERISHLSEGYKDYMLTQVPTLSKFAERYSDMVMKVLLSSLAGYVKAPWYKRWINRFKSLLTGEAYNPDEDIHLLKPIFVDTPRNYIKDALKPLRDAVEENIVNPVSDYLRRKQNISRSQNYNDGHHKIDPSLYEPKRPHIGIAANHARDYIDDKVNKAKELVSAAKDRATGIYADHVKPALSDITNVVKNDLLDAVNIRNILRGSSQDDNNEQEKTEEEKVEEVKPELKQKEYADQPTYVENVKPL